jgi:hypothetical protein
MKIVQPKTMTWMSSQQRSFASVNKVGLMSVKVVSWFTIIDSSNIRSISYEKDQDVTSIQMLAFSRGLSENDSFLASKLAYKLQKIPNYSL